MTVEPKFEVKGLELYAPQLDQVKESFNRIEQTLAATIARLGTLEFPKPPAVDLSPLSEGIAKIKVPAAPKPETVDVTPIAEAIDRIHIPEPKTPKPVDLSPLLKELIALRQEFSRFDVSSALSQAKVDTKPITDGLKSLEKILSSKKESSFDASPVTEAVADVEKAIRSLKFPVSTGTPAYREGTVDATMHGVLSMAEGPSNTVTPLQVNASGALTVTGGGGGTEYVTNAVVPADPTGTTMVSERDDQLATLAEVEGDWTNTRATSKGALWVAIPDANGDPITSFGGGTEYTEDAIAPADPVGATFMMTRDDQIATVTEAEGDWSRPRGTSKGALWVALADSAGDPITSFGGGTQYTEGDIDTTITGTAMLMEGASSTLLPVQGTVADGLLVNLGANNDVTVTSGSITVSQGTPGNLQGQFVGITAHDSPGSGTNPVASGGYASAAAPTDVSADTDVVRAWYLRSGAQAVNLTAAGALLPGSAADGLLVNLGTNNDVTVTGTVTANAGTNLNTSALLTTTNFTDVLGTASLITATQADDIVNTVDTVNVSAFGYVFDGTTWDRLRGTSADGALVNLGTNNDVTVTGTVTANSGTNLNTSALLTTTNFTDVFGTASLLTTTQADNIANTVDTVNTGAFLYAFDGTTWDRMLGNSVDGLLVNLGANNDVTVTGTVTANAGTNLNTSTLALETGGNLAAATTALQIIDDWDETDRAKVNPIVGQAGVAAGAGATGVNVQRVVQANDAGKTLTSTGGSASASGNNTIVVAGTNRLKVHAFSLSTTSTTAMTCIFQSGAGGTELWRAVIQAPTGASAGANLAVSPPAWLFATASATLLNLNLSSANAVHWSVSYVDEA
jgi:hypothetical protein